MPTLCSHCRQVRAGYHYCGGIRTATRKRYCTKCQESRDAVAFAIRRLRLLHRDRVRTRRMLGILKAALAARKG